MRAFQCKRLAIFGLLIVSSIQLRSQVQPPIPGPDPRYKTDILLIGAHPDDDTAVSTYLAKAVFDEHKRVAVIFTTRGNSGPNAVGMEQSKALADVREMEARHALAILGITNIWFLRGQDTPTQDVLHSLETVGHGAALEEVVRIIRLTRPEVILTWMPAYVAGENHGDHQASGVMATEGFDLAGNPVAFPEQIEAPRQHAGIANWGEGLHPWQAKKLYFFSDATHPDFLKGHGPIYLASKVSSAKKVPYAAITRQMWKQYATQVDFDDQVLNYFVNMPEYFVLGKSLVPAPVDGDVWTGIGEKQIAYVPMSTYKPVEVSGISLELGGPWDFYKKFYAAHGLTSLQNLVPPQSALSADRELWIPLLLHNHTDASADITLHAELPPVWTGNTEDRKYHLDAGSTYPIEIFLNAPPDSKEQAPQMLRWRATQNGITVGKAELYVYLEYNDVPQ
ncbi:MAG TPA: PIG-L family deacetylase [Terriglobales bacterium]|nr:PIG-L family deacetylase [Terriglobales bacterium]